MQLNYHSCPRNTWLNYPSCNLVLSSWILSTIFLFFGLVWTCYESSLGDSYLILIEMFVLEEIFVLDLLLTPWHWLFSCSFPRSSCCKRNFYFFCMFLSKYINIIDTIHNNSFLCSQCVCSIRTLCTHIFFTNLHHKSMWQVLFLIAVITERSSER